MGWKCAPQLLGLVRGEPKQGKKHRANLRKIALEAGYERASLSDTLDRRRSYLNRYEGYRKGAEFAADAEQRASAYRQQVKGKTKDKKEIIRERGLRKDAVIAWAVIYNPPYETCKDWSDEQYEKFHQDCRDVMAEIEPRLFRWSNIRMSAEHFDEGVPPDEASDSGEKTVSSQPGIIDRHFHDLGDCIDENGRYCGNLIDARLLVKINEKFPAMMRERGWDMDDLDRTDFERAKQDEAYRLERNAKRKKSGLSVNKHLNKKAKKMVEDIAAQAEQVLALQQEAERIKAEAEEERASLERERLAFAAQWRRAVKVFEVRRALLQQRETELRQSEEKVTTQQHQLEMRSMELDKRTLEVEASESDIKVQRKEVKKQKHVLSQLLTEFDGAIKLLQQLKSPAKAALQVLDVVMARFEPGSKPKSEAYRVSRYIELHAKEINETIAGKLRQIRAKRRALQAGIDLYLKNEIEDSAQLGD